MVIRPVEGLLGERAAQQSVPSLDGLRGVAALMVFVRHTWSLSGRPDYTIPLGVGDLSLQSFFVMSRAVDWFFVLSGFLLAQSFLRATEDGLPRPSLRRFYRRRVLRIMPVYWLALLLLPTVFTPWLAEQSRVFSVHGFVAYLFFVPGMSTLFPWSFGRWIAIGPVWTITHELTIYALLPFLAPRFARGGWRRALPAALAITIGWLALLRTGVGADLAELAGSAAGTELDGVDLGRAFLVSQFPTFAFSAALGVSLAAIVQQALRDHGLAARLHRWARPMFWSGVGGAALVMWQLGDISLERGYEDAFALARDISGRGAIYYFTDHVLMAAAFVLVLAGVVFRPGRHRVLTNRWLRSIGVLSYSIFIFHFPVLFAQAGLPWLAEMDPQWHFPVAFVLGLATTVAVSVVVWFALERPALEFGRRAPRPRTVATPTNTAGRSSATSATVIP